MDFFDMICVKGETLVFVPQEEINVNISGGM